MGRDITFLDYLENEKYESYIHLVADAVDVSKPKNKIVIRCPFITEFTLHDSIKAMSSQSDSSNITLKPSILYDPDKLDALKRTGLLDTVMLEFTWAGHMYAVNLLYGNSGDLMFKLCSKCENGKDPISVYDHEETQTLNYATRQYYDVGSIVKNAFNSKDNPAHIVLDPAKPFFKQVLQTGRIILVNNGEVTTHKFSDVFDYKITNPFSSEIVKTKYSDYINSKGKIGRGPSVQKSSEELNPYATTIHESLKRDIYTQYDNETVNKFPHRKTVAELQHREAGQKSSVLMCINNLRYNTMIVFTPPQKQFLGFIHTFLIHLVSRNVAMSFYVLDSVLNIASEFLTIDYNRPTGTYQLVSELVDQEVNSVTSTNVEYLINIICRHSMIKSIKVDDSRPGEHINISKWFEYQKSSTQNVFVFENNHNKFSTKFVILMYIIWSHFNVSNISEMSNHYATLLELTQGSSTFKSSNTQNYNIFINQFKKFVITILPHIDGSQSGTENLLAAINF